MDKVNINLLPTEVSIEQQKQTKFGKVQAISIGILLLLILLASISVGLRIFQSQTLKKLDSESQELETKVTSFKAKEEALVVLKNRLAAISQLIEGPNIQTHMFNLIYDKIPSNVVMTTASVDRVGNVFVSLLVPESTTLEATLTSLTDDQAFEAIKRIDIESLSTSKDTVFRISIKIFAKG